MTRSVRMSPDDACGGDCRLGGDRPRPRAAARSRGRAAGGGRVATQRSRARRSRLPEPGPHAAAGGCAHGRGAEPPPRSLLPAGGACRQAGPGGEAVAHPRGGARTARGAPAHVRGAGPRRLPSALEPVDAGAAAENPASAAHRVPVPPRHREPRRGQAVDPPFRLYRRRLLHSGHPCPRSRALAGAGGRRTVLGAEGGGRRPKSIGGLPAVGPARGHLAGRHAPRRRDRYPGLRRLRHPGCGSMPSKAAIPTTRSRHPCPPTSPSSTRA